MAVTAAAATTAYLHIVDENTLGNYFSFFQKKKIGNKCLFFFENVFERIFVKKMLETIF